MKVKKETIIDLKKYQKNITDLEKDLSSLQPKTKPDEETLRFWNHNQDMDKRSLESKLKYKQDRLKELKKLSKA